MEPAIRYRQMVEESVGLCRKGAEVPEGGSPADTSIAGEGNDDGDPYKRFRRNGGPLDPAKLEALARLVQRLG